jgi:hypothetical protein
VPGITVNESRDDKADANGKDGWMRIPSSVVTKKRSGKNHQETVRWAENERY